MGYENIVGQEYALQVLRNSMMRKRLSHAYLFWGPPKVGKKFTAKIFAQALNCKKMHFDACGKCKSCQKIERGNHPDVKIISPEGMYVKIEQIRDIIKDIYFPPTEGDYKIYIIQEAEKMRTETASAFLKTLEEPPNYAILILITTTPQSLLPTIISRCQLVRFNRIPPAKIYQYLKEKTPQEEEINKLISTISAGELGEAINYKEELIKRRDKILNIIFSLSRQELVSVLKASFDFIEYARAELPLLPPDIEESTKKKEQLLRQKIIEYIDLIMVWFRDLLLVKLNLPERLIINADQKERLKEEEKVYSTSNLIEIIYNLKQSKEYIRRNANKELCLQVMFLKILRAI